MVAGGGSLTLNNIPQIPGRQDDRLCPEAEPGTLTAADGEQLFYRLWPGHGQGPVVVYFHGIEGHGRWFEHTAAHLNRSGISVYAPDRRGAGANTQERGHLSSYKLLLKDMELVLCRARHDYPDRALFIMGNCWGAKGAILLAAHACARQCQVRGLVLTSPALKAAVDVDFPTKLQIGVSWLARSRRKFPIPLSAEMFTDNPLYLNFIEHDPLRLTEATASFLVQGLFLTWLADNAASRLRLPCLLLQAGKDRIVRQDYIEKWFRRLASEDKTMRTFPSSEHSLDFDNQPEDYLSVLRGWLMERGERARA